MMEFHNDPHICGIKVIQRCSYGKRGTQIVVTEPLTTVYPVTTLVAEEIPYMADL